MTIVYQNHKPLKLHMYKMLNIYPAQSITTTQNALLPREERITDEHLQRINYSFPILSFTISHI